MTTSLKFGVWGRFLLIVTPILFWVIPSENPQPFVVQILSRLPAAIVLVLFFFACWNFQLWLNDDCLEARLGRWVLKSVQLRDVKRIEDHSFLWFHACTCYLGGEIDPGWRKTLRDRLKMNRMMLSNLFMSGYQNMLREIVVGIPSGTAVDEDILRYVGISRQDAVIIQKEEIDAMTTIETAQKTNPSVPVAEAIPNKGTIGLKILSVIGFINPILTIIALFMDQTRQAMIQTYGWWFLPFVGITAITGAIGLVGIWQMRKWGFYTYLGTWTVIGIFGLGDANARIVQYFLPGLIIILGFKHFKKMR